MHELSIAMSIVELATEYAEKDNASRVTEMEIEIGSLSGVVTDALELAMEAAVKSTICSGADWKIIIVEAMAFCPEHNKEYPVNDLYSACPYCGKYGHELKQGKELRLRSLLVE